MKADNVDHFIGIDWANKKHDVCEHPTSTNKYHYTLINHTAEVLH